MLRSCSLLMCHIQLYVLSFIAYLYILLYSVNCYFVVKSILSHCYWIWEYSSVKEASIRCSDDWIETWIIKSVSMTYLYSCSLNIESPSLRKTRVLKPYKVVFEDMGPFMLLRLIEKTIEVSNFKYFQTRADIRILISGNNYYNIYPVDLFIV